MGGVGAGRAEAVLGSPRLLGVPEKGVGDSNPEGLEQTQEKQSRDPLPSSTWEAAVPHKCPGLLASLGGTAAR